MQIESLVLPIDHRVEHLMLPEELITFLTSLYLWASVFIFPAYYAIHNLSNTTLQTAHGMFCELFYNALSS
jgi:hypothetical protein